MRPAVVIDPYSSGSLFAAAFAEAGLPVVAVVSGPEPPAVYARSYRPRDFGEIITFRGDVAPVVRRLCELRPACVVTGCESGVELADRLVPEVLPEQANVPRLAAARRHKGRMAEAVAEAGLATIRQVCAAGPDEVASWLEREGLAGRDLVVKPPKSASTDGVTRVPAGEAWRPVFDRLLGQVNRLGIVNDQLVVQEYVTGTEYVVDTVSAGGRHTFTDICRYRKVDNGPHMAVYDAMEWMPYDLSRHGELLEYSERVLDALGVRFGATHTEVMMTGRGPLLLEIGARPHGGGQPRFCRVATGDSQIDRTVRAVMGGRLPRGFTLHRHLLVVFLIARASGVVRNAEILGRAAGLRSHHHSSVNMRSGDTVQMTRDLFGSLDLGFIVLAHESDEQVQADYEAIRAMERHLVIEPAGDGPG